MTTIYQVLGESVGIRRFFADRKSALTHAREEHEQWGAGIEVEEITLIDAKPAVVAVALLEGGYAASAKVIKVHKATR